MDSSVFRRQRENEIRQMQYRVFALESMVGGKIESTLCGSSKLDNPRGAAYVKNREQ